MVQFNKASIPPKEDLLRMFENVLDSGTITNNGPLVNELEAKLEQATGSNHALTIANGTLALHLAIRALKLKGEVITTPLTFIASSSSIIWEGCTPVFAEVDPETLCIDPESIKERITESTVGILPVHLYGNICDIDRIEAIADEHSLVTIYDGAQAYGSTYKGVSAMTRGTATMLSLHAYKVLSAVEGGVLFTNDEVLYNDLFKIRYFGKDMDNTEVMLGLNGKMSELNAAYGLGTLEKVKEEILARKRNFLKYHEMLSDIPGLGFQQISNDVSWNHAYAPVILPSEEALLEVLRASSMAEVELKRYFYPAVNAIPFLGYDPDETPVAFDISKRLLCLPNYASLSDASLEKVVDVLRFTLN